MKAQKHEIVCRCVLPQQLTLENPLNYSFIVFSQIDNYGNIIEKHAQCPNCRSIHRVYEFCKSEILKHDTGVVIDKEDIKYLLPQKLYSILEDYKCELHVYEEAKYIFDNKLWKSFIILTREYIKTDRETYAEGKRLVIYSSENYSIEYWRSSF